MIKCKFTILLLILAASCAAQGKSDKHTTMEMPIVSAEFERIDTRVFENTENEKIVPNKDGSVDKYLRYEDGYTVSRYFSDSYFVIVKNFFANGGIKEKGVSLNTGECALGVWYEFDAAGKMEKKEDFDQPYRFPFDNLVKYLSSRKIPLTLGMVQGGFHTEVYKDNEDGKPFWFVHWLPEGDRIEILKIDGATGKLVHVESRPFSNS
jgi:hypothetical protein